VAQLPLLRVEQVLPAVGQLPAVVKLLQVVWRLGQLPVAVSAEHTVLLGGQLLAEPPAQLPAQVAAVVLLEHGVLEIVLPSVAHCVWLVYDRQLVGWQVACDVSP
jgi:hypothetical protein